jgi:hypothetical protein
MWHLHCYFYVNEVSRVLFFFSDFSFSPLVRYFGREKTAWVGGMGVKPRTGKRATKTGKDGKEREKGG